MRRQPSDPSGLAEAAARRCGVTRVGEITRLDKLGVPVFHAIRPWSRALSVHQGKGLTREEARLGALMEAVESAHAEAFEGPRLVAAWRDLPADERPRHPDDFADTRERALGPAEPVEWTPARRLLDGRRLWVPFEAVSLDFTRPPDPRIGRSSNGQAAHFSLEAATATALFELIERDAAAAWFALAPADRTATQVALRSVRAPWFRQLLERMRGAGARLALYLAEAVSGFPVVIASLMDDDRLARRPGAYGVGCDAVAERAMAKAVLEAAQSRLTLIAGARDDIAYAARTAPRGLGLAPPPPMHMRFVDWASVADVDAADALAIARRLAAAGYDEAAVVELSGPDDEVVAVKAFAPGLAAFDRTRRRA
jgi:ribosomal protein S12 methylthiotransferase accessory factor